MEVMMIMLAKLFGGIIAIYCLSRFINFIIKKVNKTESQKQKTIAIVVATIFGIIIWSLLSITNEPNYLLEGIIIYSLGGLTTFLFWAKIKILNNSGQPIAVNSMVEKDSNKREQVVIKDTYLIGLKIVFTIILLLLPIGIWWGSACLSYFIDTNIPKQFLTTSEIEYGQEPRAWLISFIIIIIPFCLALYFPIIKFTVRSIKKSIKELKNE